MKNNKFAPTIVLTLICLVITAALVGTNMVTTPLIEKINKETADATRTVVLAEADGFTEYDGELVNDRVTECYIANNGAGMVVTTLGSSFGGDLTAMIGIDANGAITGVKVTAHADTPGLGDKPQAESHLAQYIGLTELPAAHVKDEAQVNHIVGATVSSNGINMAVQEALKQFEACGGVK